MMSNGLKSITGPNIERGIGLFADFHGCPMINFRSQQNAFGNLALRHQAAIDPLLIGSSLIRYGGNSMLDEPPLIVEMDCIL